MKLNIVLRFLVLTMLFLVSVQVSAQCAMCKTIVDTGAKNGSTVAAGLNIGILYLLGIPFLAFSTLSYAVWRRWKATQK